MNLFKTLFKKSTPLKDEKNPLSEIKTLTKKSGRFFITTSFYKDKPIHQIAEMYYPHSQQTLCRVTRNKEELSGIYQGNKFDTSIKISNSALEVTYGTIEYFDKSGKLLYKCEQKFAKTQLICFDKNGKELITHMTNQALKRKLHTHPISSVPFLLTENTRN